MRICIKCEQEVVPETVLDYPFYCENCDENLYEFETKLIRKINLRRQTEFQYAPRVVREERRKMNCKYARENPTKGLNALCSKDNHPYDTDEMGDCIYTDGEITKKASVHCSEGKELLGLTTSLHN